MIVIPSHPLEVIRINIKRRLQSPAFFYQIVAFGDAGNGNAHIKVIIDGNPTGRPKVEIRMASAAKDDLQHHNWHDDRTDVSGDQHEPGLDWAAPQSDSVLVMGVDAL